MGLQPHKWSKSKARGGIGLISIFRSNVASVFWSLQFRLCFFAGLNVSGLSGGLFLLLLCHLPAEEGY